MMGIEVLSSKARDDRARYGERLPPGQRVTAKWPVFTLGEAPRVTQAAWELRIEGLVRRPHVLDWAAFLDLPQREVTADMHCVTRWSRMDNRWRGVATAALAALAGPLDDARHVVVESHGGYRVNLPMGDFLGEDVLLAREHDGEPLVAEHGGPVRLVVPRRYGWKSAKWVCRVFFLAEDAPGTWEALGYHNRGDPWREERYRDAPPAGWRTGRLSR